MSDPDQTKYRLCVIGESDPFLARLLQRFAEKIGLQVKLARTGDEVLELVHQEKPTLIILEPELPGKVRGWEAAWSVRPDKNSENAEEIPVIACAWLKKDEALALTGPVAAYLQKPELHYEDFVAALAEAGLKMPPVESDHLE